MNRAEYLHIPKNRGIVVGRMYGQSGTGADAGTDSQPIVVGRMYGQSGTGADAGTDSLPADDVCHKPRGMQPLLSAPLEQRSNRQDLVEVFKISQEKSIIGFQDLCTLDEKLRIIREQDVIH